MARWLVCLAVLSVLLSGCVVINAETQVMGTCVEAEQVEASTAASSPVALCQAQGGVVADCWTN
jgi:hypothetical protein